MAIFPLAPDQTIAQMWSNGARGAQKDPTNSIKVLKEMLQKRKKTTKTTKDTYPQTTIET